MLLDIFHQVFSTMSFSLECKDAITNIVNGLTSLLEDPIKLEIDLGMRPMFETEYSKKDRFPSTLIDDKRHCIFFNKICATNSTAKILYSDMIQWIHSIDKHLARWLIEIIHPKIVGYGSIRRILESIRSRLVILTVTNKQSSYAITLAIVNLILDASHLSSAKKKQLVVASEQAPLAPPLTPIVDHHEIFQASKRPRIDEE